MEQHINIGSRLSRVLRQHPLEWVAIARTMLSTFKFRWILPCTDAGCIVGFRTQIINFSKVSMGRDTFIQDNVYMRAGMDGSIVLGKGVAINSFARLFGHGGIKVGDHAQIGPGALLTTTTHDIEDNMSASFKPIEIGEGAWIGANSTILSGVTIGKYSVIGAGSVVIKDIPDYSVAVGTPAKVVKRSVKEPTVAD